MIVGGLFGLAPDPDPSRTAGPGPTFLERPAALTATARGAIRMLVETLSPSAVWLPSFLCDVLVRAVEPASRMRWYEVGEDLHPLDLAWAGRLNRDDMVVAIDYFGFRGPALPVIEAARARGAFALEDASQALLTAAVGEGADGVVLSPRKFVGVVDGGVLGLTQDRRGDPIALPSLEPAPGGWWKLAFEAASRRAAFDRGAEDRGWFDVFRRAEAGAPMAPAAMSPQSERMLRHLDYEPIARKRRDNYFALLDRLADLALFPSLPEGVVPLGFPVRLPDRDRVRAALHAAEVFAPTHWPIAGVVPEEFVSAHALARSILTLPCDQRYEPADMERVAGLVRKAASS